MTTSKTPCICPMSRKTRVPIGRSHAGFTLIEMLIVVAVIGVLIAIAIPVFNTQLERAREAADDADEAAARELASAAFTAEGTTGTLYFDAVSGSLTTSLPKPYGQGTSAGTVTVDHRKMVVQCRIAEDGIIVTQWTAGGITATNDQIQALLKGNTDLQSLLVNGRLDSNSTSENVAKAKAILLDNGIDLDGAGMTNWSLMYESGDAYTLWCTSVDLSTAEVGSMVKIMRFNPVKKTWTAAYAKVQTGGTIGTTALKTTGPTMNWKEIAGQTSSTKGSYATTEEIFKNAADTM